MYVGHRCQLDSDLLVVKILFFDYLIICDKLQQFGFTKLLVSNLLSTGILTVTQSLRNIFSFKKLYVWAFSLAASSNVTLFN